MRTMAILTTVAALSGGLAAAMGTTYIPTPLVTDQGLSGTTTDANLVNAWGLAFNPAGAAWVANNGTGTSTLYNGNGGKVSLVVTVPPPAETPAATSAPTGLVFNSSASNFSVAAGGKTGQSAFIFSTEDGTISGWAPSVNLTNAILRVDQSGENSVFKGLALGHVATGGQAGDYLYATDFRLGQIATYNNSFQKVTLGDNFVDPNLPAGFAPFGARVLNNQLYVTYAVQNGPKHDDVAGAGNGMVDVFDTDGHFIKRLATGGVLDSPWGLAMAPGDFGQFSNDLLVGNFGDGSIHAFDPETGVLQGTIETAPNTALTEPGLWALEFGNGLPGSAKNQLFFTAGPDGETHGLFGKIDAVPEPGVLTGLVLGLGMLRARRKCAPGKHD